MLKRAGYVERIKEHDMRRRQRMIKKPAIQPVKLADWPAILFQFVLYKFYIFHMKFFIFICL